MGDMRRLVRAPVPRGVRHDECFQHIKIPGCQNKGSAQFDGGAPAATIDDLSSPQAGEIQRIIVAITKNIEDMIRQSIKDRLGGAAWAWLSSCGFSQGILWPAPRRSEPRWPQLERSCGSKYTG